MTSPLTTFLVLCGLLAALLATWAVEAVVHARRLRRVPLRIAVTGIRGKSSVARLIAAALREGGGAVTAKTTGSRPVAIGPDGSERTIARLGAASILEQRGIVARAAREGSRALVAEMMAVRPETLRAESRRLLRPGLLAITNVRADHLDAMGADRDAIARSLSAAIPERGVVFVPAEDNHPAFAAAASRAGAEIVPVPPMDEEERERIRLPYEEFEPNIRLALAVAERAGVTRTTAAEGIARVVPDYGSLKMWRIGPSATTGGSYDAVSLFAANEPESTRMALDRARSILDREGRRPWIGLLALRRDRGDRTIQWVDALASGAFADLSSILMLGDRAHAAERRFRRRAAKAAAVPRPRVLASSARRAGEIVAEALAEAGASASPPVIVGIGNMVGIGESLVGLWDAAGSRRDH